MVKSNKNKFFFFEIFKDRFHFSSLFKYFIIKHLRGVFENLHISKFVCEINCRFLFVEFFK
jgi:hypothetical protein